jgi:hypothetical protein
LEIRFDLLSGFVLICVSIDSALSMPPGPVKLTLEAVAHMIGESASAGNWLELRKVVQRKDFISLIVSFDSASLTPALREKVRRSLVVCFGSEQLLVLFSSQFFG